MRSNTFNFLLLGTTVFILPCIALAAVEGVEENDEKTIAGAVNALNNNGETPKIVTLTADSDIKDDPKLTLKKGSLTIDSSNHFRNLKGTLHVQGENSDTPQLTVKNVGYFQNENYKEWKNATEAGSSSSYDAVTGWTNEGSDHPNGSNDPALYAGSTGNAKLVIEESVFASSVNNNSSNIAPGAIYVGAKGTLESKSNIYFDNKARGGGAINIAGKVSDGNGSTGNTFNHDFFVRNEATEKNGGALIIGGTVDSINETVFYNNKAKEDGGAISVETGGKITSIDGYGTVFDQFEENQAKRGGAIYNSGTISDLKNLKFVNNVAETAGGAIYNYGTIGGAISGVQFQGNEAKTGSGGAIYIENGSIKSIDNNTTFYQNKAVNGGAVSIWKKGSATIKNSQFKENTATASATSNTGAGGAIVIYKDISARDGENPTLTTEGNTFTGNQVLGANSVAGGAVHNDNGIWNSTDDTFTGNSSSTDGGAIGSNGTTTLTRATISGNTAAASGGGIMARSSNGTAKTNIIDTVISGNTAAKGGGLANVNATTSNSNRSNVTIEGNTTISGNTASGNGGGIYNEQDLTIKGSGVTIKGNNATVGQNLYNDVGGVVNIESADDQVDLNYKPYPDSTTPRPSGELHTLFDQKQDIYNAGTMNIKNSNLQLHQGINAGAGVTGDRKVGAVNITGSTVDLGGSDVEGAGVMYGNTVTISDNSTIKTHVKKKVDGTHGKISANNININGNNTLDVVLSSGTLKKGTSKEYQILDGNVTTQFSNIPDHKNYRVEAVEGKDIGWYKISREGENACPGCDENEVSTNDGWLDGDDITQNSDAYDIQQRLFEADSEQIDALDGLAPDVSPLIQAHATEITQRLASIVSDRFYESMDRTGYIHRGKRFYRFPRHHSNLWIQGLYGKSKYDVRKGWDMDNRGVSVGFDGHVNEAVRLGIAYAYTNSSGESVQRDTDIKSHTGMIYGNYNPNRFYANWLAMYTRSKYDEDKKVFNHNVKANYNVDAFGAQFMIGQKMGPYVNDDWATGVIKPEIGARYIYTKQHAYTDSVGQNVGSADGSTLTGILGAQYTIGYTLSPTLSWYPELRAALTYDFMEPDTKMRVNLLNGSVYEVKTENMDRFGIEVGARIGLDINRKAEVALEYEGLFKGDYTNHTGLANLKYKF